MRKNRFPILVETRQARVPSGLSAPAEEDRVRVALKLREKGWSPYRVAFVAGEGAWIAAVIDSRHAA